MTQQEISPEDVIFGGGSAVSAKWEQVGAWVGGPIRIRPRTYHAKEYVPGQPGGGRPLFKQNGEPVYGVRVDVQTTQHDPAVDGDDGVRRMHLDKWRQLEAVGKALNEAGVTKLETGGELWVQWTGEERDPNGGQSAKTWNAKYRPPGVAVPDNAPTYSYAPAVAPAAPPVPTYTVSHPAGPAPATVGAPQGPPVAAQSVPAPAPAPAPVPATPGPQNVITASVAASLAAQGFDTSAFTIVPG